MQFVRRLTVASCHNLRDRIAPTYTAGRKLYNVLWPSGRAPQNVFITKKANSPKVSQAMVEVIRHLYTKDARIIVEKESIDDLKGTLGDTDTVYTGDIKDIRFKTDLLVTIGGDGTILRAVSKFSNYNVPPILSFSMGTLGFLLPFDIDLHTTTIDRVFDAEVPSQVLKRNRLECHLYNHHHQVNKKMVHAMNEISLHRGSNPNLISLDIYVDNQFLTTTKADGIIISTPTGSTAYSLSSGGPIAHPSLKALLLTPICPRSLSFRPLILPSESDIMIRLNKSSRNISVKLSIDGLEQDDLTDSEEIHIHKQLDIDSHIWCFAEGENDWTRDINDLLGFNISFKEAAGRPAV